MNRERLQRIDELLQQAIEIEAGARAEFLDRACSGDDELRREISEMLGSEAETVEIMKHSPAIDLRRQADAPSLRQGDIIGHYRIESRLGRGGMGEVFLARDEILHRQVAIKILSPEFSADTERVRRFEQEARAASALNHPNIITIFEISKSGGNHFIVAEFIEGRTLREMLDDSPPPNRFSVSQSLDIAIQIGGALKAAHTAWIIHRDIKPENVMVRSDGLVRVLDFGIAKVGEEPGLDPSGSSSAAGSPPAGGGTQDLTRAGAILGTVNYMSPEQARGEPLDGRTDIYSHGATRAEATEARRAGREPVTMEARLDQVPREMELIIRKSLRFNREERYASAGEMLNDLNALKHRLDSRLSRRMVKLGALAILMAVMLVSIAAWLSIAETWEEHVMLDGHTAAARRAVFSPDGRMLVSVGEDNRVIVWDFAR